MIAVRSRASNHRLERVCVLSEFDAARTEIALLAEELRIKDARMAKLDPHRRPHYGGADRLAILELRAARGWSTQATADRFLLQPATIAAWMERVDEEGASALVQTTIPINRFPEFVTRVVQSLKTLAPALGKKRIAEMLARAGLHLGATTVKRMLERQRRPPKSGGAIDTKPGITSNGPVRATSAHQVWQIDLTMVPTHAGLWAAWFPFALPPRWPFCWWLASVIDQFSRKVIATKVFSKQPTGSQVRAVLDRARSAMKAKPKYLVSDQGSQFTSTEVNGWCGTHGIEARYAAKGSLRATAVIERFFLSLKEEMTRRTSISLRLASFERQITTYLAWYHAHRPHQGLGGKTPDEVFFDQSPANEAPRFEPRKRWPAQSPCARPFARPKRRGPHAALALDVAFDDPCTKILAVVRLEPTD
jgi:putative transposase